MGGLSQGPHQENHWWHVVGWSNLTNNYFGRDYNVVGTWVPQTDWHPEGIWVLLPRCSGQNHGGGQLGSHDCSVSMWTLIQCPQITMLPCILMVPNRGMVTLHVVWNGHALDIIQREFLGCSRVRGCRGLPPFAALLPLAPSWGSWSNQDIAAVKWACFQVVVALTSSPIMIIPITLSIILDPTMTGTFSE